MGLRLVQGLRLTTESLVLFGQTPEEMHWKCVSYLETTCLDPAHHETLPKRIFFSHSEMIVKVYCDVA